MSAFEGKSGLDMLTSSSSLNDPVRTSDAQCNLLPGCRMAGVPAD
jgi:hypothetical protein